MKPSLRWCRAVGGYGIAIIMVAAGGCGSASTLDRLTEARRLSAQLLIEFTKTADAANRSVMADTDDDSAAFARESEQAAQEVRLTSDQLGMILSGLGYSDEARLLAEFNSRFSEYQALDRTILEL